MRTLKRQQNGRKKVPLLRIFCFSYGLCFSETEENPFEEIKEEPSTDQETPTIETTEPKLSEKTPKSETQAGSDTADQESSASAATAASASVTVTEEKKEGAVRKLKRMAEEKDGEGDDFWGDGGDALDGDAGEEDDTYSSGSLVRSDNPCSLCSADNS